MLREGSEMAWIHLADIWIQGMPFQTRTLGHSDDASPYIGI